jgi:putative transposase
MPPSERWAAGGFLPRMPDSLEKLDLLLLTVVRGRKVHPDGIRYQGFRYVDTTLAAYIGESVSLRYDPRDMAEIRVFHGDKFVCRAICLELAGETVPLREISRARHQKRRELRSILRDRKRVVDELTCIKRACEVRADAPGVTKSDDKEKRVPALKRYIWWTKQIV